MFAAYDTNFHNVDHHFRAVEAAGWGRATLTELQGVQVNEFLAVPASRDTGVPMGS